MARGRQRLSFIAGMWLVRAWALVDSGPLIPVPSVPRPGHERVRNQAPHGCPSLDTGTRPPGDKPGRASFRSMSGSVMSAASFQALHDRLRRQVPWGADDRRGALNHITPERLAAAGGEVRLGRTVTLANPVAGSALDNPEPAARHMKRLPGEPSDVPGVSFAADQLVMNVHGDVDSHIDALSHVSY